MPRYIHSPDIWNLPPDVFYSEEDQGYIARHPQVPGVSAFGDTEASARAEYVVVLSLFKDSPVIEVRDGD